MGQKLLTIEEFRSSAKEGARPDAAVCRVSVAEPKAYEDGTRKVRFCFSDGSIDRMGDTIDPEGWDTSAFQKNPVALFGHDSSSPPIGRASNLAVENGKLMGDIEFMPPEISGFADSIYRMVLGGYLKAVSVGFVPLEYSFVEDKDRPWGIDFKRQELLEISVVPVPANPNALAEARAKGIDVTPLLDWAEKTLATGGKTIISKAELKRLKKAVKDGDALDETDPASGGALVATCGRSMDDECGLKDPAECQVHGAAPAEDAEKLLDQLAQLLESMEKSMTKPRRREADDSRGDAGDEGGEQGHADHVMKAMGCFKAASSLYESAAEMHEKGLAHMAKAVDTLEGEAAGNPEGEGSGDDGESKAIKRARELLAKAQTTRR